MSSSAASIGWRGSTVRWRRCSSIRSGSAPDVAPETVPTGGPQDFRARVRAYEATLLEKALEEEKFNQRRAARALGLTYHQFRYHLRTHGLLRRHDEGA